MKQQILFLVRTQIRSKRSGKGRLLANKKMLKNIHRLKAQSVSEYAITISLVILAIMGMTYFIQRLFSARVNDARGYMMTTLHPDMMNVSVLRGEPVTYTGVIMEYEPYTTNKSSEVQTTPQTALSLNGPADIYQSTSHSVTLINSISTETPAQDDDIVPGGGLPT